MKAQPQTAEEVSLIDAALIAVHNRTRSMTLTEWKRYSFLSLHGYVTAKEVVMKGAIMVELTAKGKARLYEIECEQGKVFKRP